MILEDVVVIMFYSNLVIDPLVYGLGSKDFRGTKKYIFIFIRTQILFAVSENS